MRSTTQRFDGQRAAAQFANSPGAFIGCLAVFSGYGACLSHRVTNVSGNVIALDRSKGIAQVAFQHVDGMVANPYEGTFSDELDFSCRGGYSDIYAGELKKVENKREEVEDIESRSDRFVG